MLAVSTVVSSHHLYYSLAKERPWVEHLTSLPERGVGALSNVSTFIHERALMSCLQRLDALKVDKLIGATSLQSQVLMAHNTLNGNMSL